MKVAVIGKGSSGLITTMNLLAYGIAVDVYFDPKTPQLPVGESTTPQFPDLIESVLGVTREELVNRGLASMKRGIEFDGWGKTGCVFTHEFIFSDAIHFFTKDLNPFLVDRLQEKGVRFIPEMVRDPSLLFDSYDFVINCAGFDSKFRIPIKLPTVNSVLYYTEELNEEVLDPNFTNHLAHEYGWKFTLPFPELGICRSGYLFNRKHVVEAVAAASCPPDANVLHWTPSYSPSMILSDKLALNGNALLFFEPLQALSLFHYDYFAKRIIAYLWHGSRSEVSKANANLAYRRAVASYEDALAFHYQYGSQHKSQFWTDIVAYSQQRVASRWWNSPPLIQEAYQVWKNNRNSPEVNDADFFYAPDHTEIFGITCMWQLLMGLT